jgi:Na+-translocating ferredoxin:NAD+ oxidoreductase RNF subunit RnfB
MHLQPVFAGCKIYGGGISESLFAEGLCLPSGSSMGDADVERIGEIISVLQKEKAGTRLHQRKNILVTSSSFSKFVDESAGG